MSTETIPIEFVSLDGLLLGLLSLFVATAAIIALRLIVLFIVSLFEGFRKFLGYVYLTYTFVWNFVIVIFQFMLLVIIMAVAYYWFVDEVTRAKISSHIDQLAPVTKMVAQQAQGQLTVLKQYNDKFWQKQ